MIRDLEVEIYGRPKRRRKTGERISMARVKVDLGWLDAPVSWVDGHCVWRHGAGIFRPEAANFAEAHRTLRKLDIRLQRSRNSNGVTATDLERWHQRLRIARRLSQLDVPELDVKSVKAGVSSPVELQRMAGLLLVESETWGRMPDIASRTLLNAWPTSKSALEEIASDVDSSIELKALVSLIVAAAHGCCSKRSEPLIQAAIQYGRAYGLSPSPGFTVQLLKQLSPEEAYELHCFIEATGTRWIGIREAVNLVARGIAARDILLWARVMAEKAYWLPELECGNLSGDEIIPGLKAKLIREWEPLRGQHRKRMEAILLRVVRAGNPQTAPLIVAVTSTLLGPPDVLRLERPRRKKKTGYVNWEQCLLPQFRAVWQLLEQVSGSRETMAGLQLFLDVLQKLDGKDDVHRSCIWPNEWRHRLEERLKHRVKVLQHIQKGAKVFGWELAAELCRLDVLDSERFWVRHYVDPEWYQWMPKWLNWAGEDNRVQLCNAWLELESEGARPAEVFNALRPVREALSGLPRCERAERASVIMLALDEHDWNRRSQLRDFAALYPVVTRIVESSKEWPLQLALGCAYFLGQVPVTAQNQELVIRQLEILCRYIQEKSEAEAIDSIENLPELTYFLACLDADRIWPRKVVERLAVEAARLQLEKSKIRRYIARLVELPSLSTILATQVEKRPRYSLELLREVGEVLRFGPAALRSLNAFKSSPWLPVPEEGDWRRLVVINPASVVTVQRYRSLLMALEMEDEVPAGVRYWLSLPERIKGEIEWLERRVGQGSPGLVPRLENLRNRLKDTAALNEVIAQEAEQALEATWLNLTTRYAEERLDNCYRNRLRELAGPLYAEPLNDKWRNVTELSIDLWTNRKWLRRLLRASVEGESLWVQSLPGNVKFLTELEQRGIPRGQWLAAHSRRFSIPGHHCLTLSICDDPVEILRMGSYFHTCLGAGGINSFSAVANAIELNKRVIYAWDADGKVVGRQLIALTEEWKLVGFHIYSHFAKEEYHALTKCFYGFVRDFAAACRLELADDGKVPVLFVQDWYDDGIVPWPEKVSDADRQPASEERKSYGSSGSVGSIWSESICGANSRSKGESFLPMVAG